MKHYLLALCILCSFPYFSQAQNGKFDVRFGIGSSLLGSGDMRTITFENELNFKINKYLETSLSVDYGKSDSGVYEYASYIQGNLNLFVSPFKNTGRNDFRVGGGLSVMNVSDGYLQSAQYTNGVLTDADYMLDHRHDLGYSIIVEDVYFLTRNFLIGLKLFTQPYSNGDINSGALLKIGIAL